MTHQREAVEREAREIINRHCEYMDGLERGQQWMRTSSALAAVKEALASEEPTEDEQAGTFLRQCFRGRDIALEFGHEHFGWPAPKDADDELYDAAEALARRILAMRSQRSEEPTEDIRRALDELRVAADICEIDENQIIVKQAQRIRAARQVLAMRSQQSSEEPTDLVRQLPRLIYERRWLIEQLAGAWQRTEEEVAERLSQDSEACVSAMRSQQSGNSHE